jgi:glycosyltransferase involved in cell wall biosynthesis
MKIAVVTPKNISGERGGAENLYEGLVRVLNERGHDAVQIEVLVDESSFEGILEAYCNCYYLDLDDYDLVISTKAPTYMVRHRNHISYLLHTIRVFYDMFDKEFDIKDKERQKQRRLIHEFDKYGMHPSRIKKHCVIGETVAKRLKDSDSFWDEIKFDIIYPAVIELNYMKPKRGEFVFLPGRLHKWKRVDLVINAMKYVDYNTKLLIAGDGEEYKKLKNLVRELELEKRVEFLGKISNEELVEMYSRSIVVPFIPMGEDYGYITIEAFKSKKPVITCHDSGEPSLIVEDGISGFVVDPDPKIIAEKINYLIENPDKAECMGENGYHSVESITWENVVGVILHNHNSELEHKRENPRIKVLVTDNQVLDPPIGGGRVRIYQLYKNFDKNIYDITYFGTFDWLGPLEREQKLAENFVELLVPMTVPHLTIDRIFSKLCRDVITLDVTTPFLMRFTPKYKRYLSRLITEMDVLIVSHPWVYPSVKLLISELNMKPLLVYDSHNFEYKIKRRLLANTITGQIMVKNVQRIEKMLAKECDLIFACSDEDARSFSEFYKISEDKILVIPNGASIQDIDLPTEEEKRISKKRFGFTNKPVAVFLASGGYKPNDDAAKYICLELAPLLEDIDFVLIGSVCDIISKKYKTKLNNNIKLMGVVSEQDKIDLLYASDFALNPVMEGSGTNIKVFDYMAAGLPLLTTPIGARGIGFKDFEDALIAELEEFPEILAKLSEDSKLRNRLSKGARDLAERYDWKEISEIAQNGILNMRM